MSAIKKVTHIATLDKGATQKIAQYTSVASSTLKTKLGDTVYTEFIALPDDSLVSGEVGFVEYELLSADQKKRRDLETAQAYFMLYYAVPGLKQLEIKNVSLERAELGEGSLAPSSSNTVEAYQRMFWNLAISFCDKYSASGDIGIFVI